MHKLPFRTVVVKIVTVLLMLFNYSAFAGAIPIVENGKLSGADNVSVGNLGIFSVRFSNESCVNAFFGSCDSSRFVFHSQSEADLASQALSQQVLIAQYNDQPNLTVNCVGVFSCSIRTPYSTEYGRFGGYTSVLASQLINYAGRIQLSDGSSYPYIQDQISLADGTDINYAFNYQFFQADINYAVWQRQVASVPEPRGRWLFGTAVIAFLLVRNRTDRRGKSGERT